MKIFYSILILALIAVTLAEKPHDHSFTDKVKEKSENMMGNVKANANDAQDTLNQAKFKVKNTASTIKEGIKEGLKESYDGIFAGQVKQPGEKKDPLGDAHNLKMGHQHLTEPEQKKKIL